MQYVTKVKPFHVDARGEMSHLLPPKARIESAVIITCKKGAVRANHFHKKDTHYCYMLKGSMEYTYAAMKNGAKKRTIVVREGEVVVSPPGIAHAMRFMEDSSFLTLSTEPRRPRNYEGDTVRVTLI